MFSVVEFKECDGGGVALINSQWLTPRKKEVFWPPVKDTNKFNKLLKEKEQSIDTEKWSIYEVQRVFYETGNIGAVLHYIKMKKIINTKVGKQ